MARVASSQNVQTKYTLTAEGYEYRHSAFFGPLPPVPPDTDRSQPQAFLVESLTPGAVIKPHFHKSDQFQIVVAGDGSLGKHELAAVTAHYTDAFSPYGPIVAGPAGLTFFTLRSHIDAGAFNMPDSRSQMERKAGRNLSLHAGGSGSPERSPAENEVETVLSEQPDGLSVSVLHIGPGASACGASPDHGAGQYFIVLEGEVRHESALLPRLSCIFAGPGDAAVRLTAADGGASVLALQFPRTAGG